MNDDPNDDLYVGYLPAAPPRVHGSSDGWCPRWW